MTKTSNLKAPAMMAAAILMALSAAVVMVPVSTREAEAAYPGLNGKIVFQSTRTAGAGVHNPTGDYEIFTMNPDGTGITQVTDNTHQDHKPVWSPDGQQVAYASRRDGDWEIYIKSLCGSCGEPRQLTDNSIDDQEPAWSPDGQRIAFRRKWDGNSEIFTMDANNVGSSNIVNLTTSGAHEFTPDWSPDGETIAYSRYDLCLFCNRKTNIFTMNARDGSGQVNLSTDDDVVDGDPSWSPDGQKIAFSRTLYDDNTRLGELILSMNPDGGGRSSILGQGPGRIVEPMAPVWSPDGQWIAHSRRESEDGSEIYTRDLAQVPAESVNRTNSAGFDRNPDWQRPTLPQVSFQATGMGLLAGIDYGQSSTLSGSLTAGGQPLADRRVILEQRPVSAPGSISRGFAPVTTVPDGAVTTRSDGAFVLEGFTPDRSFYLRARFEGEPALNLRPITGPTRVLPVHAVITLDKIGADLSVGRAHTFEGSILPTSPGGPVRVKIRGPGNAGIVVDRTVPVASGRYGASFTPRAPGNYTVEATFAGTGDFVGDTDRKSFRVVR